MAEETVIPPTEIPAAPEAEVKTAGPQDRAAPRRTGRRGGGPRGRRDDDKRKDGDNSMIEKVVFINRCAKVVKGGRRFSFSALVVIGDGKGSVGLGFGKANEVSECIRKANENGRKNMESVSLFKTTIPHEVTGIFGGSRVFMRPASPGTGLIAGGGVRAVAEAVGIKDLLAKSIGSGNPSNVAKAALAGFRKLALRQTYLEARGRV
jgi:small subunit ribosomal protein S5